MTSELLLCLMFDAWEQTFDLSAISVLSPKTPASRSRSHRGRSSQPQQQPEEEEEASFQFVHGKKRDAFEDMLREEKPNKRGRGSSQQKNSQKENSISRENSPNPPPRTPPPPPPPPTQQQAAESSSRRQRKRKEPPVSEGKDMSPSGRPVRARKKNRKYED